MIDLEGLSRDALKARAENLMKALRLIAFANFEPIEGTRAGTVMLTIEEMRSIRQLCDCEPR